MSTIPASELVQVNPRVLSTGGNALDMVGMFLTDSVYVPIGAVQSFINATDVADYFGANSDEAAAAAIYFKGYKNSTKLPGLMYFTQYPIAPVAAYLRGGDVSATVLADLQAISGTLTYITDGNTLTAGSLSLSAATSFSSAAGIIQTALNASPSTLASFTASLATKVLTVTAKASGTIAPGQTVVGAGVTAGTYIVSQTGGTAGGIGTYAVSTTNTVSSESMTSTATAVAVTYNTTTGSFVIMSGVVGAISTSAYATGSTAGALMLNAVRADALSQGAATAVPGTFMDALVAITQDWVSFTTLFDPDAGSGNLLKLAFAAWNDTQNDRWAYIAWDTDLGPSQSAPDATGLGHKINAAGYSGTSTIFSTDYTLATFICGAIASVDFDQPNGRITFAFRQQDGLVATATTAAMSENLIANFTNFYGAYATANQPFVFFQNGQVSGDFAWLDSYINQIWMNNAFQLQLMDFLSNVNSVPYNSAGYSQIATALQPKIDDAVNFGAIRSGVVLSTDQIAAVNATAGAPIAQVLQTRGWVLQVLDPTPAVRAVRGSPICRFFYVDGQSVQQINLDSILVQ